MAKIAEIKNNTVVYRDMTQSEIEELEKFEQDTPNQSPTVEDRVQILEEAFELLLSGATE